MALQTVSQGAAEALSDARPQSRLLVSRSRIRAGRNADQQRKLQSLGKAWWQRRAIRVFRGESSLSASPALRPAIETSTHIRASRYFIICARVENATRQAVLPTEISTGQLQRRRMVLNCGTYSRQCPFREVKNHVA